MDRALSSTLIRHQKIKMTIIWIGLFGSILLGLIGFRQILQRSIPRERITTSIAGRGPIESTLTASGVIVPEYEQVVISPVTSKIEDIYVRLGQRVQIGQPLLKLDLNEITSSYNRENDQLALEKNRRQQLKVKMDRILIDLRSQLDIKQMNIEQQTFKRDQNRKLFQLGLISEGTLRDQELALKISQRELQRLRENLANQKKSMLVDMNELALNISIREKHIQELNRKIRLAELRVDREGVITWIQNELGAIIHEGDPVARIADLGSYTIDATISAVLCANLVESMDVRVRCNEHDFLGYIIGIEPAIKNGVVSFHVQLNESGNKEFRPNLRCDVFIILDKKNDVIRVKNGPFVTNAGPQFVFVVSGNKARRRQAEVGAMNFDYVEFLSGISVGEEIIISDMEDYLHQNDIIIQ